MYKLTEKSVVNLFENCCFDRDTVKDDSPFTVGFSYIVNNDNLENSNDIFLLDPKKIISNTQNIIDCFRQIHYNDKPEIMSKLGFRTDGSVWTTDDEIINYLMILGVVINIIEVSADLSKNDYTVKFNFDKVCEPLVKEYIATIEEKAFNVLFEYCYNKSDGVSISDASNKSKDDNDYILASKYVEAFNALDELLIQSELLNNATIRLRLEKR